MPAEFNVEEKIQTIFTNTAESTTNHKRSAHELRKLQVQLGGKQGALFENAFWKCLLHLFKVRKGTADVDRHVIRFLESYFDQLSRKSLWKSTSHLHVSPHPPQNATSEEDIHQTSLRPLAPIYHYDIDCSIETYRK
jgi:hypothetical protein